MAYSRKYYSYRGRRNRTKTVLTVVLLAVILAAVVVILLQRHMVYDETGTPYLELPWQREEEQPVETPPLEELELTIENQTPLAPEMQAVLLPEGQLTHQRREECLQSAGCETAVLTLKGSRVYFDAQAALSGTVSVAEDTAALLASVTAGEAHSIARMSCFHDPVAANSDVENLALKNTGGYIFYDGANSQWLDPAKPAARQYLCALAQEIAALGFDELLLTGVSYPTEGKLDKIAYGDAPKEENLLAFLGELRAALEPYAVVLSVEVPAAVVAEGRDDAVGLTLAGVAAAADRIYAPAAPEQAEAFAAAVEAAGADFVPMVEGSAPENGSWLMIQ